MLVKRLYWNEKVSTDLQFSFLFCVRDALFLMITRKTFNDLDDAIYLVCQFEMCLKIQH